MHTVAGEPGFEFLICGQRNRSDVAGYHAHIRHTSDEDRARAGVEGFQTEAGSGTRHETAVITPVEGYPRILLPWLILDVRRLVETFVMIDAKNARRCRRICSS